MSTASSLTRSASDYLGIYVWGQYLRSHDYYIVRQQLSAARNDAPLDAIYWSIPDHRWMCVSDLQAGHRIHKLYAAAVAAKQGA